VSDGRQRASSAVSDAPVALGTNTCAVIARG